MVVRALRRVLFLLHRVHGVAHRERGHHGGVRGGHGLHGDGVRFLAEFQILKPQTTFAYRFNHTLNDLVWSSWVRTFLALASHAASRLDNLYTPYLFVSAALLVVCGVHAGLKALL